MGRLRSGPRRDDPRHRHRARHGHHAGGRFHPADHLRDALRLDPLLPPGRALGDDARAHRRCAVLRLSGLQGEMARPGRRPCQRHRRLGVLARLVPGGAAEHDPGVVLHLRSLQPEHDRGVHADRHLHRLVDPRDRGGGDPALLHTVVSGDPDRGGLRDRARPDLDDPAHLPGGGLDLHRQLRLRQRDQLRPPRREQLLQLLQRPWLDLRLPRLLVPAHLECARDGGGRLLHRRMQGPCARREDRDDAGGLLRAVHLHADPGRLRGGAGRNRALQPRPRRPEHDVRQLREHRAQHQRLEHWTGSSRSC